MSTDMNCPPDPSPIPAENRCALLFGLALREQGFTPEQSAAYVRQVLDYRHGTSEQMAARMEAHAAGVAAWREKAMAEQTERNNGHR